MKREGGDACLLERFAQRHRFPRLLARIRVAARLQPALQLPVAQEEDAAAVGRDHDRAARQVALGDAAVEGIGMPRHELHDLPQVRGLVRVGGSVGIERAREKGHRSLRF